MFTAMNVNAEEYAPGTAPAIEYKFAYDVNQSGAVVIGVTDAEYSNVIEIPEKTDAGIPVVGVDAFAFLDCPNLDTVVLPDSLKLDNIDSVAFLKRNDIVTFLSNNSIDPEKVQSDDDANAQALAYMANQAEFMGKSDWEGDEEELGGALTVFQNVTEKLKVSEDDNADMSEIIRRLYCLHPDFYPTYIREEDENTLEKMSQKTYDNFIAWVNVIPYENLTVVADKDTAAEEYANGKAILGMKFEEKETHLIGDANQDGVVNVRDCAKIANALAFKTVDKLPCFTCADYNQDGEVTVRDAAQLANKLAKLK
jgi:hypothetical protein